MRIAVIGAGHAGVEAARVAGEAGAEVLLFSGESVLPYYRPRLVAFALGQMAADAIAFHPMSWYSERHIQLLLDSPISSWAPGHRMFQAGGRDWEADRIVLACGARPVVPPWAASCAGRVQPLWSIEHARRIREYVRHEGHLVVVGGGILGIEAALRGRDVGMRVTLVERMPSLMPAQFGGRASRILQQRLVAKGIGVLLGRTVRSALCDSDRVVLTLDDGQTLEADLSILAMGARPDLALPRMAGLKVMRGVVVDTRLRTSMEGVFAAGDVIQLEGTTRCSVRESLAQGKVAGLNAVASVQHTALLAYTAASSPLTFKSGDFEIYALGKPGGTDETILDGSTESVFRSLVLQDGITVGVQMIGTRQGFDEYAARLGKRADSERPADAPGLPGKA